MRSCPTAHSFVTGVVKTKGNSLVFDSHAGYRPFGTRTSGEWVCFLSPCFQRFNIASVSKLHGHHCIRDIYSIYQPNLRVCFETFNNDRKVDIHV